jgi:hypothetical protein
VGPERDFHHLDTLWYRLWYVGLALNALDGTDFRFLLSGMVELIRRVIPADIVGGNVSKLRRMDSTVHVLYEVAGTSGAFASSAASSFSPSPLPFLLY